MRLSDSCRLVFVHVPRTGGASIERVLDHNVGDVRRGPERHATLAQLLAVEPGARDYWTFGFVRNPWARLVSSWSMVDRAWRRARDGDQDSQRRFEVYPVWAAVKGMDFETYILRGTEQVERLRTPQVDWFTAPRRRADFVGRTESFAADLDTVRSRCALPTRARPPHRHRGDHGHYRDYYTSRTRDRVARLFAADIEAFGYSF